MCPTPFTTFKVRSNPAASSWRAADVEAVGGIVRSAEPVRALRFRVRNDPDGASGKSPAKLTKAPIFHRPDATASSEGASVEENSLPLRWPN